jgi:hypothetical protein
MVMTVIDDEVASITGFPSPELFPAFDLPLALGEPTPNLEQK